MRAERAYHRPASLAQALRLLAAEAEGARCIAGGTEVMLQLRQGRRPAPAALISLRSLPELRGIEIGEAIRIGAGVTVAELIEDERLGTLFPCLKEAARSLGSAQIRNAATVGGNLANASPCADLAPPLLVLDARVAIASAASVRELPLSDFFVAPGQTRLEAGEILTGILLKPPAPELRSGFLRQGRVRMDLALASLACALELRDGVCANVRLAAGSVGPIPLRLRATEELLEGRALQDERIERAARRAMTECAPISDVRTSKEYRGTLVRVFTTRLLRALRPPQ